MIGQSLYEQIYNQGGIEEDFIDPFCVVHANACRAVSNILESALPFFNSLFYKLFGHAKYA